MFEAAARDADLSPAGRRRFGTWSRDVGATLSLAWPLILSNLAGTALTTIDVILLGRLSPEALAAGALGTSLFHVVLIASIGLVTAVSPLIAAEYGRSRHSVREIRRTVRQGLWLAAVASVLGIAALWHGERILLLLGQQPDLARNAGTYLRSLGWALAPNLAFLVLRFFTAALGRPGWGLAIGLLALPVNGLLAWALVFGRLGAPALGLVGAGIATTVTAAAGLAALLLVLRTDRRFRRYRLLGRFWRPDPPRFRALLRLGLPIAATLALEVGFFGAAGLAMGAIGLSELAAHTVALQIAALCFMVPLGLSQAATIRVGHAFGAGDGAGVARAGWTAFCVGSGFMAVTALVLVVADRHMVEAFLDPAVPANAAVLPLALQFLTFAALFQWADGAQVVGAGMLRGLEDTRVPMVYAAVGYWGIGAPVGLALAFPLGLGGTGLWIGLAVGLAAVAGLVLRRWSARERLGLLLPPSRLDPAGASRSDEGPDDA